ncbi:type VI secretion system Vgr family protein [Massilia orientalis]|uniref:Type VI secretion system Vgr family protein n=1 Tax=Massilia orientalis TaxID=3050128 RepID=A0ACC7MA33_9BURK|nr:type VI secretion system Vgr family protein [Massilia sp. YIM B02787]
MINLKGVRPMADPDIARTFAEVQYVLRDRHRPLRLLLDGMTKAGNESLLAQRIIGSEAICGGFNFRMLCVSESATLPLKNFIGVPAELQIVTDRGQLRRICGLVTAAASGQSDGGLATYQLVMSDALSVLENKVNTRVFRDKSELDIVQILVGEWQKSMGVLGASFDLAIDASLANRRLPKRQFIMQHNESDAAFVRRLLQRRGIGWFFRPGLTTGAGPSETGRAPSRIGHTLVLFADSSQLDQNAAGLVRFHRDDATEQRDTITGWSAVRALRSGSTSLFSWDYLQPSNTMFMRAQVPAQADQGEQGNQLAAGLDDYQVAVPHIGDSPRDLLDLNDAQMAYHEYAAKWFKGEGSVRDLAVGEWFSLKGHPEIDAHPDSARQFVVTSQHIIAENNLPVDIGARVERLFERSGWARGTAASQRTDDGRTLRYQTSFTCVRRSIRIVPPRAILPRPQLQSAIVVGPESEVVWCDPLGRVKVRFLATRPQDHGHAAGAGSSDSDRDSAWVRVSSSWAGNGLGARLLPPVGTEVLIDFAGGDPDKPVIVGQVYNGDSPPPMFVGEDALPGTRHQSGLRSREIRGRRGNQLRLDDTTGQISAQLASDHGKTELNLGYLTEPRRENGARPRGDGAELRTNEAIALRAARGILLSAWKLLDGSDSKGTQLARNEYLDLLRECGELCTSLGNYAAEHNGLAIDAKEQDALRARVKNWEDGSNTAPEAAEPREPVIAVTSPAGIGFASSKAIVSYSASNVDTTAQQHLQLTAGQRFAVNAGNGISLFARGGGLSAIAHVGKLLVQSQHDDIAVNSARDVQVTASEGSITVSAKTILLVAQDGSFLKLGEGSPVFGSKEALKFHAPDFTWDGPETMSAQLPTFKKDGTDLKFEPRLYPHLDGGVPAAGMAYKIESAAGDGAGKTDAQGATSTLKHEQMHVASIDLKEEDQP